MKEIIKGLSLFTFDWLVVILFYYFGILETIGDAVKKIFNTPTPFFIVGFVIAILLVVIASYILNAKVVKAKKVTFIISQALFSLSFIVFAIMLVQALVRGIMMFT